MDIQAQAAVLITGVQDIRTTQYLAAAAITLWTWDLLINFADEVDYVWSRNILQWGQMLYLLNRYLSGAILAIGVDFILRPPVTPEFCRASIYYALFSGMGTVLLVQSVLMLRVCAIWGQSKIIRAIVAAGCLAEVASILAIGLPLLRPLQFTRLDLPTLGIHACVPAKDLPSTRYQFWIVPLLFDVLLFVLVVIRGWNDFIRRTSSPGSLILRLIIRDSTLIFLYNLLAQSSYIFLWRFGRSGLTETPSEMGNAIDIIFATRMLLNLWSRFYAPDFATTLDTRVERSNEVFAMRTIGGSGIPRKAQYDTFWALQEDDEDFILTGH